MSTDPKMNQLIRENENLINIIQLLARQKEEILVELGQVRVEKAAEENRAKKDKLFKQIYRDASPANDDCRSRRLGNYENNYTDQTPLTLNSSNIIPSEETSSGFHDSSEFRTLSFSVQQHDSGMENISLDSKPPVSVATTLCNNYKLLLLTLAQRLLASDVVMLKDWAAQNFPIENPQNAIDVLFQLDEKRVINASDLSRLSDFFESIIRFDLVYVIDAFLRGDYDLLRQTPASERRNAVEAQGAQQRSSPFPSDPEASSVAEGNLVPPQTPQARGVASGNANEGQSAAPGQQNGNSSQGATPLLPCDSNGSTISTLQRSDTEGSNVSFPHGGASENRDIKREFNWSCSHYNRHCSVKFGCCDEFWPCHRCHNNNKKCGEGERKSHEAILVKCVHCNEEQQFSPLCSHCGTKFANYFCQECNHLTGADNFPYHCAKCRICRIHGDRSFHCDVCGVCVDNQYHAYHVHDKCCICLKDVLVPCPNLPCCSKFHEECFETERMRRRFVWCGICGKSFDSEYLPRRL